MRIFKIKTAKFPIIIKQAKQSEKIESVFIREYILKTIRTKKTNTNTN